MVAVIGCTHALRDTAVIIGRFLQAALHYLKQKLCFQSLQQQSGLAATGGLAATAMKLHADQAAALGLQAIQSLQLGTT